MKILDSHGGVVSEFHYDESEDKTTVNVVQDCEPIIEKNKALQSESPDNVLGRRIASIPLVVVQKWMQEDGVNFLALPKHEKGKYLRRKLNDPEYRYLRTSGGVF